ncbi:hypothetical protein N8809_05225 [Euryarchaeota archaeon]|nr:hypothetical protein [Euryarchaeota archaeon]|tara:strand:+ start:278 stop:682 length:405 start_codon:yes stop_codon:yes gene_type:complete
MEIAYIMVQDLVSPFWDFHRLIMAFCLLIVLARLAKNFYSPKANMLMSIEGVGETLSDRITDVLRPKASFADNILLVVWGISALVVLIFEVPQDLEQTLVSTTGASMIVSYLLLLVEVSRWVYIFIIPFMGPSA